MSKNFTSEREGQLQFFDKFAISDTELANYTDGIYKGTIFEFKKSIPNINAVLFQAVKYLSHMRVKGVSIPANILLVALNEEVAYLFQSTDYIKDIEMTYAGAASKNNSGFAATTNPEIVHYDSPAGIHRITEILANESLTKISIDVFDVVGWSERFYREVPSANKIKLFEELRAPKHFEDSIQPWTGDEKDFKYIMDLLNDKQHKKELGAFYTPAPYCLKATELVRKAIAQIPKDNDYIILDRCAGTGNLEDFLTDKAVDDIAIAELDKYISRAFKKEYLASVKDGIDLVLASSNKTMSEISLADLKRYETAIKIREHLFDNELGHTIVNTYELKEWLVLNERIGDRVKLIIPPQEEVSPAEPLVTGGDALSAKFVTGQMQSGMSKEYKNSIELLLDYVQDEKTNIILLENPPYSDVGAVQNNSATAVKRTAWKNSYVCEQMKKWIAKNPGVSSRASNDLANLFIWSGFEYYLRKPEDSYVLFSPPKYIKSQHLIAKEMAEGYIFNRAHFHANSASAISCIWWRNLEHNVKDYNLEILDIQNNNELKSLGNITVKKVYKNLSVFYDRYDATQHLGDEPGIILEWNGRESDKHYPRLKPIYNPNLVGYLVAQDFGFEHPRLSTNLVRTLVYAEHGFYLRKENYLAKLPLFAAGKYEFSGRWWENGTIFKCSDGGDRYSKDSDFLKACLIFTCLSYFNKCRSLEGGDGRLYKNELCFDKGTLATQSLAGYKLSDTEQKLLTIFNEILRLAKTTENYNPKFTWGVYQIDQDLNTYSRDDLTDTKIYDHPQLNTALIELKSELAKYYESVIQPKLFEYELLK
jgi:hypothetical protein